MKIVNVTLVVIAFFLVTVWAVGAFSLANYTVREMYTPKKLYTVKTADAVYLDLTRGRSNGTWANYTTVDGKMIIFNGTFTEIEQ